MLVCSRQPSRNKGLTGPAIFYFYSGKKTPVAPFHLEPSGGTVKRSYTESARARRRPSRGTVHERGCQKRGGEHSSNLLQAVKEKDVPWVKRALNSAGHHHTLVQEASLHGYFDMALRECVHTNCVELVALLLPYCNVSKDGWPLRVAAMAGSTPCVALLLPHCNARFHQSQALRAACQHNHFDTFVALYPHSDVDEALECTRQTYSRPEFERLLHWVERAEAELLRKTLNGKVGVIESSVVVRKI